MNLLAGTIRCMNDLDASTHLRGMARQVRSVYWWRYRGPSSQVIYLFGTRMRQCRQRKNEKTSPQPSTVACMIKRSNCKAAVTMTVSGQQFSVFDLTARYPDS